MKDLLFSSLTAPLFALSLTLLSFQLGRWVYKKSGFITLLSPIVVAIAIVMVTLLGLNIEYETYFENVQFIHFLLGPATVALALPLFEQRQRLAQLWAPICVALFAGASIAIISAILIGGAFGASSSTLISLAPKSVTTPIAMGVSKALGGLPDLSAAFVVVTGIFGGLVGGFIFKLFPFISEETKGFSLGLAAHGMGTSAAFQISEKAGAFAGLGMAITGLLTAFLAPLLTPYFISLFA